MSLKATFNRLRYGRMMNRPGPEGETYLTRAVKMGDADAVRQFLALGADPDRTNHAGEYPLHLAIDKNNPAMLRLLLESGANLLLDGKGAAASEYAAEKGLTALAKILSTLEDRQADAIDAAFQTTVALMGGAPFARPPRRKKTVLPEDQTPKKPPAPPKP